MIKKNEKRKKKKKKRREKEKKRGENCENIRKFYYFVNFTIEISSKIFPNKKVEEFFLKSYQKTNINSEF